MSATVIPFQENAQRLHRRRRARAEATSAGQDSAEARDGSVASYPAANGTVTLVALGPAGEWLGDFRCYAVDFNAALIETLQRFRRGARGGRR